MRRYLYGMCIAALVGVGAPVVAAESAGPDALVRELYDKWLSTARAQREAIEQDRGKLYELTETTAEPYIDFDRLSRLVLGKHWREASEDQRKRFTEEFRDHLVRTYATAMYQFVDAEFTFLPSRHAADAKQVVVKTYTIPKDGRPKFPVNYILYNNDGRWLAMDVTIEGISVVATLRNIVRAEVQSKTLDGVIEEIHRKNQKAR